MKAEVNHIKTMFNPKNECPSQKKLSILKDSPIIKWSIANPKTFTDNKIIINHKTFTSYKITVNPKNQSWKRLSVVKCFYSPFLFRWMSRDRSVRLRVTWQRLQTPCSWHSRDVSCLLPCLLGCSLLKHKEWETVRNRQFHWPFECWGYIPPNTRKQRFLKTI